MFGFPPILDGNAGIKFTNNADSGFPKPGIREIFYSIKDGNWTDTTVWQTASGRVGLLPSANDDVYIRHTITLAGNATLNNLIITPTGTLNGNSAGTCLPIIVNGSLLSYGTLNYAPNSTNLCGGAIELRGTNNYIDKTKQTATHIRYSGPTSQPIIDANYSMLVVGGSATCAGEKYLTCDLTIGRFDIVNINTTFPTWLNFKNFNFTCNGVFTTVNSGISIHSEGNQTLIFKGAADFNGGIYCLNAPTIEFQNGAAIGTGSNQPKWVTPYGTTNSYLGTGTIRFTTNSQTLGTAFVLLTLDNIIEIADNITLTISYTTSASLTLTNTINGLGPNSRLTNGLNSTLNFGTATAATTAMSTGLFDFTTNANTIQYNGNYSATIPSYFTTFHNLTIGGTGTKTLGVNTTLNGNLSVNAGALELSTFNLSTSGTTTIGGTGGSLTKSGAGNVLFTGLLLMGQGSGNILNFSGGNPTVEFRGGMNVGPFITTFSTGTGQWSFSTASQTINTNNYLATFDCPILINGAIDVTVNGSGTANVRGAVFNNTVNGNNINSKLINRFTIWINTTTAFTGFMSTGIFDISTFANIVVFSFNGNATIPYTSFSGLIIKGTGTKTLSNNTTLSGALEINTSGTLELSTFDLSVTGATTIGDNNGSGTISKNGAGNILFGGLFTHTNGSTSFTGNPNVELRGGTAIGPFGTFNSGAGTWTFTTASQSFGFNNYDVTFNCNILISGAITVTFTQISVSGTKTVIFNGVLNGDNAASTFRMGATTTKLLSYRNATQPMATGILDTSTNLNTFIYGSGAQNIKGGPSLVAKQVYRNLTLNGGGVKTLQGYVSVQNTYTLTPPATLALNGFTLTNP